MGPDGRKTRAQRGFVSVMGVEGGGWRWKCEGEGDSGGGGGDRELAGNQFLTAQGCVSHPSWRSLINAGSLLCHST